MPTFDADSIWNFFAGEPMNDVGLRANVDATDQLSVAGGGHVRVFERADRAVRSRQRRRLLALAELRRRADVSTRRNGHPFDEGGDLSARWRNGRDARQRCAAAATGATRATAWAATSRRSTSSRRATSLSARTGVWQWDDKLQPDREHDELQLRRSALGYRFAPRSQAMVEWEHDINGLVGQRFRLMLLLTLAVTK